MIVMWRDSVIAHLSPFNCLFFSLQFEPPVNGQNPIVCGSMTRSVSDTYTLQKPCKLHPFLIRVTTFLLDVSVLQIIIFKINEPVLLSVQKYKKLANVFFVYGSVTRFSGVSLGTVSSRFHVIARQSLKINHSIYLSPSDIGRQEVNVSVTLTETDTSTPCSDQR